MDGPVELLACGGCTFQQWDLFFPPSIAWSLICPLWWVALCSFSRMSGVDLVGTTGLVKGLLIVAAAFIAALAAMGPLTLLPFGLAGGVASIHMLRLSAGLPPGTRAAGHAVGALGVLALLGSGAWSVAFPAPATAQSVIRRQIYGDRWTGEFERLVLAEPGSLPAYRELVGRAVVPALLERTLARVEALGRPEEDVPVLLDALERRLRQDDADLVVLLDASLRRMSGCAPPPGSGIEVWRRAWKEKAR